jgi:hypothetical protein
MVHIRFTKKRVPEPKEPPCSKAQLATTPLGKLVGEVARRRATPRQKSGSGTTRKHTALRDRAQKDEYNTKRRASANAKRRLARDTSEDVEFVDGATLTPITRKKLEEAQRSRKRMASGSGTPRKRKSSAKQGPKRAPSAYNLYTSASMKNDAEILKLPQKEKMAAVGKKWKEEPETQKQMWKEKSEIAKIKLASRDRKANVN